MSDEIRVNRPAQQAPAMRQDSMSQSEMAEPSKSSKAPWIILAVIVLVLVVLGVLFRNKLPGNSSMTKGSSPVTTVAGSSGYQAVFLTNGQVYFGKLNDGDGDYPLLTDIYYLQVGPQQGSGTPAQPAPQQSISLVKLGNELHGPVDEMHINRSQILFYEDMKSDSSVVKAILAYKASPSGTPAPTK